MSLALTRIALPSAPEQPARPGFPWAATIAPVILSVVLWAVTGSMFGLLFALLGPVVAVAGLLDGARSRRRSGRRALERFGVACDGVLHEIEAAHAREHARLSASCARADRPRWDAADGTLPVLLGTGVVASTVELTGETSPPDSPVVADRLAQLQRAASEPSPGPVVRDAGDGLGIVGSPVLAAAVARSVVLQLAASVSPAAAELRVPAGEEWTSSLPHPLADGAPGEFRWLRPGDPDVVVAWAEHTGALPQGCGTVLVLDERIRPRALGREPAARAAAVLGEAAPARAVLPERVALAALLETPGGGLSAPIGRDADGVVSVDLVAQGPHALVAGTTGSGKSELLVSWVLAMAHGRSPAEVTFLLIDFKGGAAFAPLAGLPHVLGTLSDLDAGLTRRAVLGLRAELLRRERVLAAAGARSIDDLPAGELARLVIVVDEFAALVAGGPELQDAFGDLAARGRSLGLHLVLCTQRPSGVVRDAVLANIGLRISLRVTDRGDALAMLGDDAAARLPAEPRGRAILQHDGPTRAFQVAVSSRSDAERIAGGAAAAPSAPSWWVPLPERIDLGTLPTPDAGWAFGRRDLPAEQQQPVAVYDPATDGSLLVAGASGSGVTTALVTLAESARRAGERVTVLGADPADVWAVLEAPPTGVLVADDLDVLLDRFSPDHRHEVLARLGVALRAGSPRIVAGVRRVDGEVARLAGLFGARLVLRQATREDLMLAGGAAAMHDPAAPPGRGSWQGEAVQVAIVPGGVLPEPARGEPVRVTVASHPHLAVVSTRPRDDAALLTAAGWRIASLDAPVDDDGPVARVGDPDDWNAHWALLTAARRDGNLVLRGCSAADQRALLPGRGLPPPLGDGAGECWLAAPEATFRGVLTQESVADRASRH